MFHLLNVVGSAGLTANTAYHEAWPSAALNVVWMVVGLVALGRRGAADRSPHHPWIRGAAPIRESVALPRRQLRCLGSQPFEGNSSRPSKL